MKKFGIICLLFCLCTQVQAQTWAPTGARWYYTYVESLFEGLYGYVKIESVGEVTIDSKTASELTVTVFFTDGNTESMPNVYCYENGGNIYVRVQDDWELMYDFTTPEGNTHEVFGNLAGNECGSASGGVVTIQHRDDTLINDETLAYYTSEAAEGSIWHYPMKTIEKFGNLNYMFASPVFCDIADSWQFGPLRAYIAPDQTVYKILQIPYDTLIIPGPDAITMLNTEEIEVHPNPTTEALIINILTTGFVVSIRDLSGRAVYNGKLEAGVNIIDVSNLHPGLYTIAISDQAKSTLIKHTKMVKL